MSVFFTTLDSSLVRELGMTQSTGATSITPAPAQSGSGDVVPFEGVLRQIVGEANGALNHADAATTSFARGQQHDLHGTMLALSQANIRLQLVSETRNHLLEAYREVMRMSV